MRREALALITLIILFIACGINVVYVNNISTEFCNYIETSKSAYENADYEEAERNIRKAIDAWDAPKSFITISLRHSEIDAITDSLYDLLSEVLSRSDEAQGGYEHVLGGFRRIAEMETPTFGSIF